MKKVLFFTASWCGGCQMFKPIMQELAVEGHNIQFIDVDNNSQLASEFMIRSIPAVVVLQGDNEITRFSGVKSKAEVSKIIS